MIGMCDGMRDVRRDRQQRVIWRNGWVALAFDAGFGRRLGQIVEQGLDAALRLDQPLLERVVLGTEQDISLAQQIILGAQRLGQLGEPVDFV